MRVNQTQGLAACMPRRADPAVAQDAQRLMRLHGERAFDAAALFAWQEDIGLLYTPVPGHWDRVKLEIAARDGHRSSPGRTARIQALHLM